MIKRKNKNIIVFFTHCHLNQGVFPLEFMEDHPFLSRNLRENTPLPNFLLRRVISPSLNPWLTWWMKKMITFLFFKCFDIVNQIYTLKDLRVEIICQKHLYTQPNMCAMNNLTQFNTYTSRVRYIGIDKILVLTRALNQKVLFIFISLSMFNRN